MKRRNPLPLPSEIEVEAIETLLSLPILIKKYELLSFTWGGIKKKRSVLVNHRKVTSSSLLDAADKSPSTPLCFRNSDDCFDNKAANKPSSPSLSLNKILKKKLVDYLKVKLSGMQEENDKLKRDIASMAQKKQELQAQNLELKAKKQKISCTRNMDDMQLWNNPMKVNIEQLVQQRYHHHQQIFMFAPQQQQQQQQQQRQQYVVDPNTGKVMTVSCSSNINSGGSRFGLLNQIEPRVQRETYDFMSKSQPLDHGKYMVIDNDLRARNCAAARKRRIIRMKENKNSLLNMRLSRGSR